MTQVATRTLPAWIVGSSGLLAGELARLIEDHPGLHLAGAVSRQGDRVLREMHPQLASDLRTMTLAQAAKELEEVVCSAGPGGDVVLALFLGLPHGHSASAWMELSSQLGDSAKRVAVVDLSADMRIADPELFEKHYAMKHPDPAGEQGFVYGLPEYWKDEIRSARRIAAPGCFATALQLAVLPAAIAGKLDTNSPWILHGVTGSSGSGIAAKPTTHHPFRHGSYKAYSPAGHRHEAELQQALSKWDIEAPLHFLPHSGPWSRGIHLSASLPLAAEVSAQEIHDLYTNRYTREPFVEVLALGSIPELRYVVGSNRASLGIHVRGRVLTVLLAIDNTIKGGSGQALQCMNLMLGEPENAGLSYSGLGY
ncbi:MAG: N-acetyl-gamma-glutamyl-phosphate/LysW-gamma-L-alpha-aminoadipyl-6-phosphate reductase [Planctomycetota bacterium]